MMTVVIDLEYSASWSFYSNIL